MNAEEDRIMSAPESVFKVLKQIKCIDKWCNYYCDGPECKIVRTGEPQRRPFFQCGISFITFRNFHASELFRPFSLSFPVHYFRLELRFPSSARDRIFPAPGPQLSGAPSAPRANPPFTQNASPLHSEEGGRGYRGGLHSLGQCKYLP